jgi:Ca2+-binding RTX toxin-like protein
VFQLPRVKFGTGDDDNLSASSRIDILFGLGGNDTLSGGDNNDVLSGGSGNDMLSGGASADRLYGGFGHDELLGGAGNDAVFGGRGADTISGGSGDDKLKGGAGADKFLFDPSNAGEGHDVILDFTLGTDAIVLRVEDVLESTPGLLALAGDPAAFEPEDLDASPLWNLSASEDGDLLVTHPTGTIELNGIAYADGLTFRDILPALELV